MKNKLYTSIGLMSGTSMDGVDISLIKSDGYEHFTKIIDKYYEYDDNIHEQLVNLRNLIINKKDLDKYSKELNVLERIITLFHGKIVNNILSRYKKKIDLVGFHGQTIFHDSKKKFSKQLGDGNLLSQFVKKNVIFDFRQADLENDGQGAPLAPIFHNLLARSINKKYKIDFPISLINIGGISNITNLINKNDLDGKNLNAFDIGPGNCLIDDWVRRNSKKNLMRMVQLQNLEKLTN